MFFIKIRNFKFYSLKLVSNAFIWKPGYIGTLGFKSKYLLNAFDKMYILESIDNKNCFNKNVSFVLYWTLLMTCKLVIGVIIIIIKRQPVIQWSRGLVY